MAQQGLRLVYHAVDEEKIPRLPEQKTLTIHKSGVGFDAKEDPQKSSN